jgi:hypothetical protein
LHISLDQIIYYYRYALFNIPLTVIISIVDVQRFEPEQILWVNKLFRNPVALKLIYLVRNAFHLGYETIVNWVQHYSYNKGPNLAFFSFTESPSNSLPTIKFPKNNITSSLSQQHAQNNKGQNLASQDFRG